MDELVSAAWTTSITLVVVFAVAVVAGFGLLFRRGSKAGRKPGRLAGHGSASVDAATRRANILLVRADDAVRDAEDELGFAVAQFGANATAGLSRALADARRRVMEAFALQQRLDDHVPDTGMQRREWTARIVHLCETAQAGLSAELRHFDALRALDRNAPANLAALRAQLAALETRRRAAVEAMALLHRRFAAGALASVSDNIDRASEALSAGTRAADAADSALGGGRTVGTVADGMLAGDEALAGESAIDAIRDGEEHARRATHLFAAIDTLAEQLATASRAMVELIDSTRSNLTEARTVRDDAADAAAGASVNDAIARTEATLAAVDAGDPVVALDRLREANALLDTSLAGERNQRRRLEGAREALTGALVSARSQLSATRDFITTRRGGVGSEARTRLAEGERLLRVAEVETDPVLALDTARSAATYARDADALARYDVHH